MDVGAILIVEGESGTTDGLGQAEAGNLQRAGAFLPGVVALTDLLGRSLLEHTIDRFINAGVGTFAVVLHGEVAISDVQFRRPVDNLRLYVADETWSAVLPILNAFGKNGIDGAFVMKVNAYCEPDIADFWDFHSDGNRTVTRACDPEGPLDLWLADCDVAGHGNADLLKAALLEPDSHAGSYFVHDYVKRVGRPGDLRHLVKDFFHASCHLHPSGEQLRTGIWMDEGAQIRGGARIVGPAYVGRQCVVGECSLITRSSNLECSTFVDCGTAIEDSMVFPDTYVGMWLDVRHSLVSANKLFHLERGVCVEISDSTLLRSNATVIKKTAQLPLTRMPEVSRRPSPESALEERRRQVTGIGGFNPDLQD